MSFEIEQSNFEPIIVEMEDFEPQIFAITFSTEFPVEINFGIPGPKGEKGDPGDVSASSVGQLADVEITNPQNGDTLVYSSSKFRNTHIENLTDGGNF